MVAHLFDVRIVHDLDTTPLQLASVERHIYQIIWNESDAVAKLPQELENLERPD
jgi:hypothetical protein